MSIMKRNELSSRYFNSLSCKIFILGHATQGESAIIFLCDGAEIVYTCVVDSFVSNDRIVVKDMLHGFSVPHITDLFWTHPHDDHSDGIIELIEEFSPENVFLSAELHSLPDTVRSISSEVLNKINTYKGYDKRIKYAPKIRGICTNYTICSETLHVGSKFVPFTMFTIAPSSGRVRKKVIDNQFNSLNDFSLAFSVNIGDFSILLTGDIQNRMIDAANEDLCQTVYTPNLLKIPHHGSNDSTNILNLFDQEDIIDFGVTTAKKSSSLPRDTAMKSYSARCDHTYYIDPKSTHLAVWGIEADIIAGTVKNITCKAFEEYVPQ